MQRSAATLPIFSSQAAVILPAFTPPALNPAAEIIDGAATTAPTPIAVTIATTFFYYFQYFL